MPANSALTLYDVPSQKGKTDTIWVSDGQRYRFVRRGELPKLNVGKSLSSLTLHATPGAAGFGNDMTGSRALLFGDQEWINWLGTPIYYPNSQGFSGRFLQLTNLLDDSSWDVDLRDMSPNLDNRVTGIVLVDSHRRDTLSLAQSLRDTVAADKQQIIDRIDQVSDRVSFRSGPHVSWAAFVAGDKYLAPDRAYANVTIGLWIDLPDPLTKIKGTVTYYLDLWAENGQLRGWMKKYAWWRGKVALVGEWASAIMEVAAELSWYKINYEVLPPMLDKINAQLKGKLVDVYTLPGDQTTTWFGAGGWHSALSGSSVDGDVTAVFELSLSG